jgi:TetR/AcrR family transcriptional repressor of nem operon
MSNESTQLHEVDSKVQNPFRPEFHSNPYRRKWGIRAQHPLKPPSGRICTRPVESREAAWESSESLSALTITRRPVINDLVPRPPNLSVRHNLLNAGKQLFHENGFNGCGVQDITAAAGVPKGSFYNYFATKEIFVVEVVEEYWKSIDQTYSGILQDPRKTPVDRIKRYFRVMSDAKEANKFAFGCLIGNLSLEITDTSEDARAKLGNIFKQWEARISDCLREAQVAGALKKETNVRQLAAVLIESWEGAVMRGKVERRSGAYRRFESFILEPLLR